MPLPGLPDVPRGAGRGDVAVTAVDDFIAWARNDRDRADNTIIRYRSVLRDVGKFGDPLTISMEDVERWWASRYEQAPGTRANELACLRSFFKWATKFDHRPDDPTRRLDAPKVPNKVPRMVGRADFERLLGPLTEDHPDLRRVFALGGYAGLRIHEAAGLDWRDIDEEARRIFVRGKGQKERPVPLSPVLLDYLLPRTGGNVACAGGAPYSAGTLQRKANRLMERNGISHTFHDFRKRGASIALSKGANPAAVRVMFGWESMETVMHYAVVGDDELDRIAEMLT
jgi:integrase/recombinase XerD